MNKKVLFALIMAFGIFGLAACSNDDDVTDEPFTTAWSTEIQAEIEAMSLAAQTYATDPTPANCEAYRTAAQAYIDALKPYGNCATLQGKTEWHGKKPLLKPKRTLQIWIARSRFFIPLVKYLIPRRF